MTPGVSKDIQCHVLPYIYIYIVLNHQVTHKVECQLGDCKVVTKFIHFGIVVWSICILVTTLQKLLYKVLE